MQPQASFSAERGLGLTQDGPLSDLFRLKRAFLLEKGCMGMPNSLLYNVILSP
jgi:hypothetical protein